MANTELKNELTELLENAESVKSLEPMKRGALKDKLLSLPDKGMRQAVEQLKDEREKLTVATEEMRKMSAEARNETRTLHALSMNERRKEETVESHEQSEEILEGLKKENGGEKKGDGGGLLAAGLLLLAAGAVILLLKYFNYL